MHARRQAQQPHARPHAARHSPNFLARSLALGAEAAAARTERRAFCWAHLQAQAGVQAARQRVRAHHTASSSAGWGTGGQDGHNIRIAEAAFAALAQRSALPAPPLAASSSRPALGGAMGDAQRPQVPHPAAHLLLDALRPRAPCLLCSMVAAGGQQASSKKKGMDSIRGGARSSEWGPRGRRPAFSCWQFSAPVLWLYSCACALRTRGPTRCGLWRLQLAAAPSPP